MGVVMAVTGGAAADERVNLVVNSELRAGAAGEVPGWTTWAPRPGVTPDGAAVDEFGVRTLKMTAKGVGSHGKWLSWAHGIEGGKFYRFEINHRTRGLEAEEMSAAVVLSWYTNEDDRGALQRDYIDPGVDFAEGWARRERTLQAPERAKAVKIELVLRWAAQGTVWWTAPKFTETSAPLPRRVRIATMRLRPGKSATVASNLHLMAEAIDRVAKEKPDLVLFSEMMPQWNVAGSTWETAQPIPGPITAELARKASQHRTYVATSLLERDGDRVYNTAVLMDRVGGLVGRYRKVHLPMEEADRGVTPGSDYPVFTTDFGRVGMLVCWDNWFPEPARALRLRGAEIILLPTAGDGNAQHWDAVSRTRAQDNGVYLVSSSMGGKGPSGIVDPSGEILVEARDGASHAIAEIDLNRQWRLRWLSVGPGAGEASSLYIRERRPDTYQPLTGMAGDPRER